MWLINKELWQQEYEPCKENKANTVVYNDFSRLYVVYQYSMYDTVKHYTVHMFDFTYRKNNKDYFWCKETGLKNV